MAQDTPIHTNHYEVASHLDIMGDTYSFLDAFGNQPSLTEEELVYLPEGKRKAREDAFYAYLQGIYGVDVRRYLEQGYEARRLNAAGCPVERFYTLSVQAVNGTAEILETDDAGAGSTGGSSLTVRAGSWVKVQATPESRLNDFIGWVDVTDDPESDELLAEESPYTYPNLQKDATLEARYAERRMLTVVVENNDGRGTVSGGGTVPEGDSVFVSTTNLNPDAYEFVNGNGGWYVKGTNTRINSYPEMYYRANRIHADSDGVVTLEARYELKPVTVSLVFDRKVRDVWYFRLKVSRPVSCMVWATATVYDVFQRRLGGGLTSISPGETLGAGNLSIINPVFDSDFLLEVTNLNIATCEGAELVARSEWMSRQ